MNSRNRIELLCAWSGLAFLTLYIGFFAGVAQFVPPPSPDWDAERVAEFFASNTTGIRLGQIGTLVASFLIFPLWALISVHLARIEARLGRPPLLAIVQLSCAVVLQVFFVMCSMLWLAASFRGELSPESVRVLNDFAWLIFVMVVPGYLIQMLCIGVGSLCDQDPDPVIPRWAGYFHLWVGISGLGGIAAVFFKDGPFAWNGLIAFYLPVAIFVVWLFLITALLHRRAVRPVEGEGVLSGAAAVHREEPVLQR